MFVEHVMGFIFLLLFLNTVVAYELMQKKGNSSVTPFL